MSFRWTWSDPATGESWEMPRNPHEMTSPHGPRNLTIFSRNGYGDGAGGVSRVIERRAEAYVWSFTGKIRTPEHYAAFLHWTKKVHRTRITDHFGRTWEIRTESVEIEELKPTPRRTHRFDYTVKATMYRQVS